MQNRHHIHSCLQAMVRCPGVEYMSSCPFRVSAVSIDFHCFCHIFIRKIYDLVNLSWGCIYEVCGKDGIEYTAKIEIIDGPRILPASFQYALLCRFSSYFL